MQLLTNEAYGIFKTKTKSLKFSLFAKSHNLRPSSQSRQAYTTSADNVGTRVVPMLLSTEEQTAKKYKNSKKI